MKTKAFLLGAAMSAMVGGHAFSQPSYSINPVSGLPVAPGLNVSNSTPGGIDPATGIPQGNGGSLSTAQLLRQQVDLAQLAAPPPDSGQKVDGDLALLLQAKTFIASGQYEQALQCFLSLDARAQTTTNNVQLQTALPDWIELGKKYPTALHALTDIRDLDTRELTQGRGNLQLFQKVAAINENLADDAATADLFKDLRANQPARAKEWFIYGEPALVRCGEYQLCLECLGNPETWFKVYCQTLRMSYGTAVSVAEHTAESRRRMLATLQQPGRPPPPLYMLQPDHTDDIAFHAITNSFAVNVSCLVEILVHTDHAELADKIRTEAATVLASLPSPPATPAPDETVLVPGTVLAGSSLVFDKPTTIAPSNQFFGPTIEVTLTVNSNGLSDVLNLDYNMVTPLADYVPDAFMYARLPANGIAIFPPQEMSQVTMSPLKVVSKRTRLFQRPQPGSQQDWDGARPPAWLSLPDSIVVGGLNQVRDQAMAFQVPPVLMGFQTSLGNAGLLSIAGYTVHPHGVIVHYKLLHNSNPPEIPNPDASPEDWSPAQPPIGMLALSQFRQEIKNLMDQERYPEALERQVWYFNHALQYGETDNIRLTFGTSYWEQLNQRYPKSKLAMAKIRDRDVHDFFTATNPVARFQEISKLDLMLHDDAATAALFVSIDHQDEKLAGKCYGNAASALVQKGDYALCLKYLGDPQARFDGICALRQYLIDNWNPTDPHRKANLDQTEQFNKALGMESPRVTGRKFAQAIFIDETRELIEILVATGHQADARKIHDEAILVVDDPSVEAAVTDAQQKLAR